MAFPELNSLRKYLPSSLQSAKVPPTQELILLALFVAYIVFPVKMPHYLAAAVESPLGLLSILAVTLFLFMYTHPLLGIVYLFVAYELLNRSGGARLPDVRDLNAQYTPIHTPQPIRAPEPPSPLLMEQGATLEENVIQKMAPAESGGFVDTSFKPMSENIHSAFMV
jgi:hypothetical protein